MSEAQEAIRNLLGRYCESMDAGQWQQVGALFAGATLTGPTGEVIAEGADAVAAFYERGTKLHDGSPRTRHVTTNTIIDVAGEAATARSAYVVFQSADDFPLQPIVTGRYEDAFICDAGTWRFARRQFLVDAVGDLSHHLTYEVS